MRTYIVKGIMIALKLLSVAALTVACIRVLAFKDKSSIRTIATTISNANQDVAM